METRKLILCRCVQMYRDMGLTVLQPNEGSL